MCIDCLLCDELCYFNVDQRLFRYVCPNGLFISVFLLLSSLSLLYFYFSTTLPFFFCTLCLFSFVVHFFFCEFILVCFFFFQLKIVGATCPCWIQNLSDWTLLSYDRTGLFVLCCVLAFVCLLVVCALCVRLFVGVCVSMCVWFIFALFACLCLLCLRWFWTQNLVFELAMLLHFASSLILSSLFFVCACSFSGVCGHGYRTSMKPSQRYGVISRKTTSLWCGSRLWPCYCKWWVVFFCLYVWVCWLIDCCMYVCVFSSSPIISTQSDFLFSLDCVLMFGLIYFNWISMCVCSCACLGGSLHLVGYDWNGYKSLWFALFSLLVLFVARAFLFICLVPLFLCMSLYVLLIGHAFISGFFLDVWMKIDK